MKRIGTSSIIAICSMAAWSQVWATPVTWRASGTVDLLAGWVDTLPYSVGVGDAFSLEFSFNDETLDSNLDPASGQYGPPGLTMMTLQFGSNFVRFDLASSLSAVNVLNNYSAGTFDGERDGFLAGATQLNSDSSFFGAEIVLYDDRRYVYDEWGAPIIGEGPLTSDALPAQLLDLNSFTSVRQLYVSSYIPNVTAGGIFGTVTSLVAIDGPVVSVPEPATFALFGIGLLGAGCARRRRVKGDR